MVKIGIPTDGDKGWNEQLAEHFGRSNTYTIVDLDNESVKIITNSSSHMGGQGYPPDILARENVHILLCQGLGRRAITMFKAFNIDVYIGAEGTVKDAVEAYKQGSLQKASEDNACGRHAFRDQHHHEQ